MAGEPVQEVVVNAVVTDAYDGLIRLLGDAQRFGFALRASTLSAEGDGSASVTLMLTVPARLEVQLVARLARHPVVRSLDAQVSPTRAGASHLCAVAA